MKAETAAYLAKARECLADAGRVAALPRLAAREAYYAAFHAAEAYIFEHTGKVACTHRGVRSEFTRLTRSEPRIRRETAHFLGRISVQVDGRLRHRPDRVDIGR